MTPKNVSRFDDLSEPNLVLISAVVSRGIHGLLLSPSRGEMCAAAKELRMTKIHRNGEITRRGFFERSAGALVTAGILSGGLDATDAGHDPGRRLDLATPDPTPKCGKIALEEHFALPGTIPDSYTSLPTPESRLQIQDLGSGRIAEMDRTGLGLCILSESGPASIQTVLKTLEASGVTAKPANGGHFKTGQRKVAWD